MKKIILAATLSLVSTMAFSAANSDFKGGAPGNTNANPDNSVAVGSSQVTGNGAVVGGHGTNTFGGTDQTTAPGTRGNLVQGALGHTDTGKP